MGTGPTKINALPRDLWWFRQNVPCLDACPVKTDAGRYVQLVAEGRFAEAYRVARSPNPIASICGRTCGAPCEDACRRGKIDEPVSIRALKRFLTEHYGPESLSAVRLEETFLGERRGGSQTPGHGEALLQHRGSVGTGGRVAVVGAGPAGLACAHDLALMGHAVTVFEAQPLPGGMMRYGIPAYRLPREVIEYQVGEIEALGVEFRYGTPIEEGRRVRDLLSQGFGAVFLAIGAGQGRLPKLEGVDSDGVIKATDYLLNINRGFRVELGSRVVVIGGGLVALDAARTVMRALVPGVTLAPEEEEALTAGAMRIALDVAREAARRGAFEITVVSLESESEIPAAKSVQGKEELDIASQEGVRFLHSWGPKRIRAKNGKVESIDLVRCTRVFDENGRFSPLFDEGEVLTREADTVILAIGQAPDLSFLEPEDGIETTAGGTIQVDPATLATSRSGVFAGGDGAFPPSLLITVAEQGKVAARSIDAYLRGTTLGLPTLHATIEELPTDSYARTPGYEQCERHVPITPLARRSGITEVESSYTMAEAQEQAERCLYCHIHPIYDGTKCVLCARCVDICPEHCLHFAPAETVEGSEDLEALVPGEQPLMVYLYDEERCIRCGLCAIRCPTQAITMEQFQFEEGSQSG